MSSLAETWTSSGGDRVAAALRPTSRPPYAGGGYDVAPCVADAQTFTIDPAPIEFAAMVGTIAITSKT